MWQAPRLPDARRTPAVDRGRWAMLKRLRTLLTGRKTVIAVMLLLVAAMLVAVAVPQDGLVETNRTLEGPAAMPRSALVQALGLHHVFSTWWFAALALVFILSLVASTADQLRAARAQTWKRPAGGGEGARSPLSAAEVGAILRAEGYRRLAEGPGAARWVRHAAGYWGTFLLHVGMTLTAVGGLVYTVTQHRVVIRAVADVPVPVIAGRYAEQRGILAWPMDLPFQVRLERLEPAYWEGGDHLRDLASTVLLVGEDGRRDTLRVAVNENRRYRGLLAYQQLAFGHTFLVALEGGPQGQVVRSLFLPMPERRDRPSYGEVPLEGPLRLQAKYYATPDRSRLLPAEPQLTLRLQDGAATLGEATLAPGEGAALGPYRVGLLGVAWWSDILFEGSQGTVAIFTGFAVLLLGGALGFFAVPREATVLEAGGGSVVHWRTPRLPDFYAEERDRVLARCQARIET